ncbi:hypothetical protein B484DRAFT_75035 [Ochromonadaceae sp. CCMP2298]|nr:hypothetical protein B484DRAFT_75035 [Ochromonadaceae sp. CCMP2298]
MRDTQATQRVLDWKVYMRLVLHHYYADSAQDNLVNIFDEIGCCRDDLLRGLYMWDRALCPHVNLDQQNVNYIMLTVADPANTIAVSATIVINTHKTRSTGNVEGGGVGAWRVDLTELLAGKIAQYAARQNNLLDGTEILYSNTGAHFLRDMTRGIGVPDNGYLTYYGVNYLRHSFHSSADRSTQLLRVTLALSMKHTVEQGFDYWRMVVYRVEDL